MYDKALIWDQSQCQHFCYRVKVLEICKGLLCILKFGKRNKWGDMGEKEINGVIFGKGKHDRHTD